MHTLSFAFLELLLIAMAWEEGCLVGQEGKVLKWPQIPGRQQWGLEAGGNMEPGSPV